MPRRSKAKWRVEITFLHAWVMSGNTYIARVSSEPLARQIVEEHNTALAGSARTGTNQEADGG